jgi:hypothetical protein
MANLNQLLSTQGEPIYFTPLHVWADIYQPDPSHAMANPPFDEPK